MNPHPSERLSFEPVSMDWLDAIFAANTGLVKKYFYDFKNKSEAEAWLKQAIEDHNNTQKKEFVIAANNEFVGMVSPRFLDNHEADIGLWIAEHQQRKGYASETLRSMLEYLRANGVTRVIYEVEKGNDASLALMESLGMKDVSTDQDPNHRFVLDI